MVCFTYHQKIKVLRSAEHHSGVVRRRLVPQRGLPPSLSILECIIRKTTPQWGPDIYSVVVHVGLIYPFRGYVQGCNYWLDGRCPKWHTSLSIRDSSWWSVCRILIKADVEILWSFEFQGDFYLMMAYTRWYFRKYIAVWLETL